MDRHFEIKRLTEENAEQDKAIINALNRIREVRRETIADTVREMQTRFKELMGTEIASCGYCNAVGYWSVKTVKENIARVAKEMLEEGK